MESSRTTSRHAAFTSLLSTLCTQDGSHETSIPGFYLTRYSTVEIPRTTLSQAVMCVVAQGIEEHPDERAPLYL